MPRNRYSDPACFDPRQSRSVDCAPITESEYRSRGTRILSSRKISRIECDTQLSEILGQFFTDDAKMKNAFAKIAVLFSCSATPHAEIVR